jgi:hypothetical protein
MKIHLPPGCCVQTLLQNYFKHIFHTFQRLVKHPENIDATLLTYMLSNVATTLLLKLIHFKIMYSVKAYLTFHIYIDYQIPFCIKAKTIFNLHNRPSLNFGSIKSLIILRQHIIILTRYNIVVSCEDFI